MRRDSNDLERGGKRERRNKNESMMNFFCMICVCAVLNVISSFPVHSSGIIIIVLSVYQTIFQTIQHTELEFQENEGTQKKHTNIYRNVCNAYMYRYANIMFFS